MKKSLAVFLTICAVISLSVYAANAQPETEGDSITKTEGKYEVNFENAKLIDTKIDGETGVKIEVYTIENWANQ